jgi:hypothetical protein
MNFRKIRRGAAMIMSIVVLAILAAWAVSISSISGINLQLAENQKKTIHSSLQTTLTDYAINNISPDYTCPSPGAGAITISTVTLDSTTQQSFAALITQIDADTLRLNVTGNYGAVTKTITADYKFGARRHTVFDYGVATKGPLHLAGNIELTGVNISVESDVFIESENQNEALSIIGNSQIAGDVKITNPDAYVTLQGGQAAIGGETGEAALDHVSIGESPPEFPPPNPAAFEGYAVNILDSSTDTSVDATFDNIRIAADTHPVFTGDVTLRGVVFIETPNIVTFAGGTTITGIIVGNGDCTDNSATSQINLLGTVQSSPISELPVEEQFVGLHDQTGTFILAPGFHVAFGGNFNALSGAIAGNGIEFFGDAGGTINGTVINYSDQTMNLSGNNNLYFNRSGNTEIPAGFIPEIVLAYDPNSYAEVGF